MSSVTDLVKAEQLHQAYRVIEKANKELSTISPFFTIDMKIEEPQTLSIRKLVNAIYEITEFPRNDYSREKLYLWPRYAIMYYLKIYREYTLKEVGHVFGGRDHSTVVNAIKEMHKMLPENKHKSKELLNKIRVLSINL